MRHIRLNIASSEITSIIDSPHCNVAMKRLLRHVDPNFNITTEHGAQHFSYLHYLSEKSYLNDEQYCTFNDLIDVGADVQKRDEQDNTPLHYAARVGNVQAFDILINNQDVDITALNANRKTPMDLASALIKDEFRPLFVIYRIVSNIRGKQDTHDYHHAYYEYCASKYEIVQFLQSDSKSMKTLYDVCKDAMKEDGYCIISTNIVNKCLKYTLQYENEEIEASMPSMHITEFNPQTNIDALVISNNATSSRSFIRR